MDSGLRRNDSQREASLCAPFTSPLMGEAGRGWAALTPGPPSLPTHDVTPAQAGVHAEGSPPAEGLQTGFRPAPA